MNINMFFLICAEFEVKKASISSFYKENNFKPCLTKQLLNMFKLWCERGISLSMKKLLRVRRRQSYPARPHRRLPNQRDGIRPLLELAREE